MRLRGGALSGRGRAGHDWLRPSAAVIALLACAGAQWHFRSRLLWKDSATLPGVFADPASLALIVAAVLTAVLLGRPYSANVALAAVPRLAPRARRREVLGLAVGLVGATAFAYSVWLLRANWPLNFDIAVPVMVAGITIWSIGLALADQSWRPRTATVPMARWEWGLLLAIVALGFFMRFYRYDYYPPDGVCAVEEPQAGQATYAILHAGARPWEFAADRWLPVPFFLLMGPTLTAVRLPFSLISGLTVPALYLLLRQLVTRPVALWSTALFAVCSWHLVYARLAHNIFATTLIVVLLLAMCVRVHQRSGMALYPWIGFLTGYTLYTYAGYRGTVLFVGLFLAISFGIHVWEWRTAILPRLLVRARRVVILQAVGLVLGIMAFAGPVTVLVQQVRGHPQYYVEAANRSLIDRDYYTSEAGSFVRQRVQRLYNAAMIFNHLGDGSESFNLPGAPMLDAITAALGLVGLLYCVFWWRHRWQGFYAFMFLVLFILGTTFVHNLDIRRLQGIIPLIFVLIAFAADRFQQMTMALVGGRARSGLVALAVALVAGTAYLNYDFFFGHMIRDPRVRAAFHNSYTVLIRHLRTLPRNTYVVLMGTTTNFFGPNDFEWLRDPEIHGQFTDDLLPVFQGDKGPWRGRDLHVILENPIERDDVARLLERRLPGTRCVVIRHPDAPARDFTDCTVTPSAGIVETGGVHARYFRGEETQPFLERVEPAISYAFTPDACREPLATGKRPCRVEWVGTWEAPQAAKYHFTVETQGGTAEMTVDEMPVTRPIDLQPGPHTVRVITRYNAIEDIGTRVRYRVPAGGLESLPFSAPVPQAP